jgi:response regulator NasT
MEKALLICDAPKTKEAYETFLKENGFDFVLTVSNGESGKRELAVNDYEVCLINAPLKNGNTVSLAADIAGKNECQVILFIKEENFEEIASLVEPYGVFTISKPVQKLVFASTLKMTRVITARMAACNEKIRKMQKKLDEVRLESHAKCLLVENKGITEAEAHRYLEKQAMDQRCTKREIAEAVIDFYS